MRLFWWLVSTVFQDSNPEILIFWKDLVRISKTTNDTTSKFVDTETLTFLSFIFIICSTHHTSSWQWLFWMLLVYMGVGKSYATLHFCHHQKPRQKSSHMTRQYALPTMEQSKKIPRKKKFANSNCNKKGRFFRNVQFYFSIFWKITKKVQKNRKIEKYQN